ncbi:FKBP-type peptidyl-prolyl cis-trans isomerase [Hyphococcus sp.]|uniref:FKBP-type peptidyl-prolyl cis-trans isomerase n=1 Tax=Hyphococcus sp. TaxID=2038636 RepID=UPI003D105444
MVLEEGPEGGYSPDSTDLVIVHYVGTLKDGVEFDSSRARGAAAQFPLNRVIPGWTEGVQLMSEGDRYRFFVPPDLAYGEMGTPGGPIGPNEALIFDVELIKVQNAERNLEAAKDFLAENAKKDGVKTTSSGLQYQVISQGPDEGKSPEASDTVEVHYQGTLLNGTEFDSSYSRGETIEFPLNRVIPGWTEGVQLMSEGDKFRFFIPPDLAYGEMGTPGGPIGPNEALIFEVELVSVK